MAIRHILVLATAMSIFTLCASATPDAEILCLQTVGEIHASIERCTDLLDEAVIEIRPSDRNEKLGAITSEYSALLEELNMREPEVPGEVQRAHRLLVSAVGMQESALMSIRDGISFSTPDLIDDGAKLITLSR